MEMLHVLNGDSTRYGLELADVPGAITVWADILHEGPAPANVSPEEWRRVRAAFLSSDGYAPESFVLERYEAEDAVLARYREFDEVIFWFEHDLYDQLLLLRHLHWIHGLPSSQHQRFRLICIGSFPGFPNFAGLGELSPAQLKSLLPQRQPITAEQIAAGVEGWNAFRASSADALREYVRRGVPSLPFMQGALQRHLDEYPDPRTGLSRTERQILTGLTEGLSSLASLFLRSQQMEERIYMGDTTFAAIARRLASCRRPLLTMALEESDCTLPPGAVTITPIGRDVLDGRSNHVALNGIDRWLGGVHLVQSATAT